MQEEKKKASANVSTLIYFLLVPQKSFFLTIAFYLTNCHVHDDFSKTVEKSIANRYLQALQIKFTFFLSVNVFS